MKKIIFALLMLTGLFVNQSYSQEKSDNKVIITGTRFTYPVVEKWLVEFKKTHPDVNIRLARLGEPAADSANLRITSHDVDVSALKAGETYVAIAKYGLLTIANEKSPLVAYYKDKGLQEADINQLFFTDHTGQKLNYVVYTREQKSCAPISFASYFGHSFSDLSGTKVPGDDKALLQALRKDSLGISYNNLGYVYDIRSRKLAEGIAILPVDLNHNGKIDKDERFYNTLDEVIARYEGAPNNLLATEDVNVVYQKSTSNPNLQVFLNWVLNDGQKYNHEVGFLNFNTVELAKQKQALANN